MQEIRFYHEFDDYGYFSNYWVAEISVEGKTWASSEHYYQSCKTLDPDYRERIRLAPTPDDAKTLGNSPECVYRADWDTYKDTAMRIALNAKFRQHDDLKKLLIESGDAILIENSATDYYWGCGEDGTGKSMLGKLLMELRSQLISE